MILPHNKNRNSVTKSRAFVIRFRFSLCSNLTVFSSALPYLYCSYFSSSFSLRVVRLISRSSYVFPSIYEHGQLILRVFFFFSQRPSVSFVFRLYSSSHTRQCVLQTKVSIYGSQFQYKPTQNENSSPKIALRRKVGNRKEIYEKRKFGCEM